MRKRGKSRYSYPVKRTKRWNSKYTVDAVTKRAKKLLPITYPLIYDELIDWDNLERMLFPEFENRGIDPLEYDYYMAWAKRKAEKGLKFIGKTMEEEALLLKREFVGRGLKPEHIDALEHVVDDWVSRIKGAEATYPTAWIAFDRE